MKNYRIVFGPYSSFLSDQQAAGRYGGPTVQRAGAPPAGGMLLQSTNGYVIPRLRKYNPSIPFWCYCDATLTGDTLDPTNSRWAYLTELAAGPAVPVMDPNWYLYDANKRPIITGGYHKMVLNPGAPGHSAAWAKHAIWLAESHGFASGKPGGVWADDVTGDPETWWFAPLGIAHPYDMHGQPLYVDSAGKFDRAAWQTAMFGWADAVTVDLHAAGLDLGGNIGGAGVYGFKPFWAGMADRLDQVFDEEFADYRYILADQLSNVVYAQAQGKAVDLSSTGLTRQQSVYEACCMMLVDEGNVAMNTSHLSYGGSASGEQWWPEFTTLTALAAPAKPYRVNADGTLQRDFGSQSVKVNPKTRTWVIL